jgi:hypothetical protein
MKVYILYGGVKYPWESTRFLPVRGDVIHYAGSDYRVVNLDYFVDARTNEIIEIQIVVYTL